MIDLDIIKEHERRERREIFREYIKCVLPPLTEVVGLAN
jgi:hypothetical protein